MKPIIGIDLGTTNSALAQSGEQGPEIFSVKQLVAISDVQARPGLPSFLYLARQGELPDGSLDLPWAEARTFAVGHAARDRGGEAPAGLVSSAKSWLSHTGVDRRAPLLPPGKPEGLEAVSPVEASARYLEHLRAAFDADSDIPLAEHDVFLTVPASFDAVARNLTLEAAAQAGLPNVTLLEEPQAAFYAWLARVGDAWRERLSPKDLVLVCDVGGGTTDFSLISVDDDGQGNLTLDRVAVGDHILLGGDNMDLALAHVLSEKLKATGKKIDAAQGRALVQQARRAKEKLLTDAETAEVPVTLLGRGSKLIGGKIKTTLLRLELEQTLVEGFFPACGPDASPQEARRTGFMELGLPYVSDAAITRHLARFVRTHAADRAPTHVLFNGGVFNSPLLRKRLLDIIGSWAGEPKVLEESDHDLAVAKGAAWYGALKAKGGLRIRGGVGRSYWVGIEGAAPAVPGVPPPLRTLCVVPFGMEEGTEAEVPELELGLVVGEPVEFRLFTSTTRNHDQVGAMLDEYTWPDHLSETSPMVTTLEADGLEAGDRVPVRLEVRVTEIGTLEIWSVNPSSGRRWRLEYDLREAEAEA